MRVALILPFAEGILRFRGPLLAALVARGHRAIVLSPDPGEAIRRGLASLGVEWREVPLERASLSPKSDLRAIAAMAFAMREVGAEMSVGFNPKGVLHGTLAAAEAQVPKRFAMVTGLGHAFAGRDLRAFVARWATLRLARKALPKLDGLVFQNPDDRATLSAARVLPPSLATAIIPGTGVDTARFAAEPLPERPAFLMASRLLSTKGTPEYLAAAAALRTSGISASCRLAGWLDANPAAITRAELDRAIAAGDVEFLGRLDDVRPAIAAASVCVLPSHREGLPLFLLESMSMGRAVIATDVPGCRELVEHGVTGLLVPPRNPVALAAAMRQLAEDTELASQFGAAARARAFDRFDSRRVCEHFLSFLGLNNLHGSVRPSLGVVPDSVGPASPPPCQ